MHPRRSVSALVVLLVAVGAIWFYLPRTTSESHTSPVSYVQDSTLEIGYASSTGMYRGTIVTENCNLVSGAMLPSGTTTVRYTLAVSIERQSFCTATGAVPHSFSASLPAGGSFEGVTVNGAIVPYSVTQE